MSSNLDIWNSLGRTSPSHTKSFQRAGGFKGTAIKPIYTEQKMTEEFGPAGMGWGFSEPNFQLVSGSDGQLAVYCWLTLWYVRDGVRSDGITGVGGDFVIVKQSSGLRTDDEAFKKAFTDAIGNAMKHLGMSADVHMGRFDDSKYVRELEQEEAEEKRQAPKPTLVPKADTPFDEIDDRTILETMIEAMQQTTNRPDLDRWWSVQKAAIKALPKHHRDELVAEVDAHAASLENILAAR